MKFKPEYLRCGEIVTACDANGNPTGYATQFNSIGAAKRYSRAMQDKGQGLGQVRVVEKLPQGQRTVGSKA